VINVQDPKLLERAHEIYLETGIYLPILGTPEGNRAYKLWVEWISFRLAGDIPEAEANALVPIRSESTLIFA
jgi:hypothetical protein